VKVTKEAVGGVSKKSESGAIVNGKAEHALKGLLINPDTKGGEAAKEDRSVEGRPALLPPTLGRECSA
jgi:hypothetical protein